jgi:hypothetical protein
VESLITSTVALPKGTFQGITLDILLGRLGGADLEQSIQERLHNTPKLYGSEVREHGKVSWCNIGDVKLTATPGNRLWHLR